MNTRKIITVVLVVIILGALIITHIPKQLKGSMTVCTDNGETAKVSYDIQYYRNLILPSYVKGSLTSGGVTYIDRYTKLKEFPSVTDNRLIPSDWRNAKSSVPYNTTFIRSDSSDVISASLNRIDVLEIVIEDRKISRIAALFSDKSFRHNDSMPGISVWGPAENVEEAKQVAESFGYRIP